MPPPIDAAAEEHEFLREFEYHSLSPWGRLLFEVVRNQFRVIHRLDMLLEQNVKIMDTLTDLGNAITTLVTDETAAQSTILQEIAAFLATQPGGTDFTAQVTALQGVDAAINALPGQVQAAFAPATSGTSSSGTGTAPAAGGTTATANVARKAV
jgi:hypothetical protein